MQEDTLTKKSQTEEVEIANLDFRMHTIIMLVGPSGCGKTHFVENKLIPELKSHGDVSVKHISSDEIRKELLFDPSAKKGDKKMTHVSKPAFELLKAQVEVFTSYPVNTDFVIVDSTGLNKNFRDEIKAISKNKNYNLVVVAFDYGKREPYYKFINRDSEESTKVTSLQLDHFRKKTLGELGKKHYQTVHKIKSHDLGNYKVNITNYDRYQECILPEKYRYIHIGDIHGCYDEFYRLIEKNGFAIDNGKIIQNEPEEGQKSYEKRFVLVGDLVDKGYSVRWVIELVYNNSDMFYMVKGNHENFVYRYLKTLEYDRLKDALPEGEKLKRTNEVIELEKHVLNKKEMVNYDLIETYFDSIKLFDSDDELKQKFYKIVERMKPFLKTEDFIVTHAPCDQKYLGKLGPSSERGQRTIVYPKQKDFKTELDFLYVKSDFFSFFREQASRSLPYHVFGHVQTNEIRVFSNKVNLDTGCVSGGKLTSVVLNKWGRPFIKEVSSKGNVEIKEKKIHDFYYERPPIISLDNLDPKEKSRIKYSARDKVNFLSGTVCPANKVVKRDDNKNIILEDSELESIDQAINYYKHAGVKKVIAQPKYMGSRADVYLFKDKSLNYTTTRKGYIIKYDGLDLTDAYNKLYKVPFIKKAFKGNTNMIILDAELLPWSCIGKGLIERDFVSINKALETELNFLKKTGFQDVLNRVHKGEYAEADFDKISYGTKRKELAELLGSNNEATFRCIRNFKREYPDIFELEGLNEIYARQIELYGSEGEVHFKPFSILKQVFDDGTEELFFDKTNEFVYSSVNSDNYIVVDITDEEDVKRLKEFYDNTTVNQGMEGIMLKPEMVYVKDVAPAIKVRNPRYLTIIYGPDYQTELKLAKLIDRKKTRRKLEISIREWEIGKRLLEIPYNQIEENNEHYVQAFGEMIIEENNERELDPRL